MVSRSACTRDQRRDLLTGGERPTREAKQRQRPRTSARTRSSRSAGYLCRNCGSNRVSATSMRGATGSPRPSTSLGLGTSSMTPPEHDHRTRDARAWGHDANPPRSPAGRYGAVSFRSHLASISTGNARRALRQMEPRSPSLGSCMGGHRPGHRSADERHPPRVASELDGTARGGA